MNQGPGSGPGSLPTPFAPFQTNLLLEPQVTLRAGRKTHTAAPRFSLLRDPSPQALKPWESVKSKHLNRRALQRTLVPTRSIPVKGIGAPTLASPSSLCPPPVPSPMSYLWELQLLSRRFAGPVAKC
ncbi:uncharacterized protein C3orf22 homolog [Sorex araneus]|uniref:uncharacterized protein C3orf22 homolog n=1 Tax=Sorex araneus TaxID=42254 RepID=UPI002433E0E7|nr:uncharacterized protein C3orf22 homolog [Sorex araneus]